MAADQGHQVGERQKLGQRLGPAGQVLQRKEGPAEQEHREDQDEDRQVEGVDLRADRGRDQTERRE